MKLDLESYYDVSELDVWLDVFEFWFGVEGRWLDLELNWRKLLALIWRSRNKPWFWWSKGALLDLEMTLYFGRVLVGFFSPSFSFFSYEKSLFIGNSIIFNLEFSLNIYWELITNFEFKYKFDLNFGLSFNKNIPWVFSSNVGMWLSLFDTATWLDFICWSSASSIGD